jgi:hypothetical protein
MGQGALLAFQNQGEIVMVERAIELRRRRRRQDKMRKLKAKLARAKDGRERDLILQKIRRASPLWQEPAAR